MATCPMCQADVADDQMKDHQEKAHGGSGEGTGAGGEAGSDQPKQ